MHHRPVVAAVAALLASTGCGSDRTEPVSVAPIGSGATAATEPTPDPTTVPTVPDDSDLGGSFGPVRVPGEFEDTPAQQFTGTIRHAANGCWLIDVNGQTRPVAFPTDFVEPASDTTTIVAPSGWVVGDGTSVDVFGRIVSIDELPGAGDGRWGNIAAYCDPGGREVARLDLVDPAYDPAAQDPGALVDQLRAADFTESWPCGFQFAISTADQRFGLVLSRRDGGSAAETVTLPSTDWAAEVIVGKHLFVQHCDDAVEQWEASPVVLPDPWPLTSGTFEPPVTDDEIGACVPNPVSTRLTGAIVATPAGAVELPPITMHNEAWGCFAG